MAAPIRPNSIFNVEVADVSAREKSYLEGNLAKASKGTLFARSFKVWGPTSGMLALTFVAFGASIIGAAACGVLSRYNPGWIAGRLIFTVVGIGVVVGGVIVARDISVNQSRKALPIDYLEKDVNALAQIKNWKALLKIADYQRISGLKPTDLAPQEAENLLYVNARLSGYVEGVLANCTEAALSKENNDDIVQFYNAAKLSGVNLKAEAAKPLVDVIASRRFDYARA